MFKFLKNENGFTLIELIIVVTILGIISAIFLPNFFDTSDKVRLKSDIVSAHSVQSALDLYTIENSENSFSEGIETVITTLVDERYLNDTELQTSKAKFAFSNDKIVIDVSDCDEKIRAIANKLLGNDKKMLIGLENSAILAGLD